MPSRQLWPHATVHCRQAARTVSVEMPPKSRDAAYSTSSTVTARVSRMSAWVSASPLGTCGRLDSVKYMDSKKISFKLF